MTYKLLKPINFEGAEIEEIEYDFNDLTGNDIIKAEREVGLQSGDIKILLYSSPEFQSSIFALAAKKPVEMIRALKAPDFAAVTAEVQAFLLTGG